MSGKKYKRLMLVDGYNVIRATGRYSSMIDDDGSVSDVYMRAREALIGDVAYAAQGKYEACIVFDGGGNPHSDGKSYKTAGVQIVFSAYGQEADTVIEKLATQAREHDKEVLVVTSDAATQWTVVGDGVSRLSSRMFNEEIELMRDDLAEDAVNYSKNTLVSRLPADIAEKLRKMSRGEGL